MRPSGIGRLRVRAIDRVEVLVEGAVQGVRASGSERASTGDREQDRDPYVSGAPARYPHTPVTTSNDTTRGFVSAM